MRDIAIIDGELRLVTGAWRVARQLSDRAPNTTLIDQLLDERIAVNGRAQSDISGLDDPRQG